MFYHVFSLIKTRLDESEFVLNQAYLNFKQLKTCLGNSEQIQNCSKHVQTCSNKSKHVKVLDINLDVFKHVLTCFQCIQTSLNMFKMSELVQTYQITLI